MKHTIIKIIEECKRGYFPWCLRAATYDQCKSKSLPAFHFHDNSSLIHLSYRSVLLAVNNSILIVHSLHKNLKPKLKRHAQATLKPTAIHYEETRVHITSYSRIDKTYPMPIKYSAALILAT